MKTRLAVLLFSVFTLFGFSAKADPVPQFGYLPDEFINPVLTFPMTDFWHMFGQPESGLNYYTQAGPTASSPYWERMNPSDPMYQVFVGSYVVGDFQYASEWNKSPLHVSDIPNTIQKIQALTTIDQTVWLMAYGAPPTSVTSIDPASVRVIKGLDGWFVMYARMNSFSDLGAPVSIYPWVPPYSLYQDQVDAYHSMIFDIVTRFKYDQTSGKFLVIYGNTCRWTTKDGTQKHTPVSAVVEVARAVFSVTY